MRVETIIPSEEYLIKEDEKYSLQDIKKMSSIYVPKKNTLMSIDEASQMSECKIIASDFVLINVNKHPRTSILTSSQNNPNIIIYSEETGYLCIGTMGKNTLFLDEKQHFQEMFKKMGTECSIYIIIFTECNYLNPVSFLDYVSVDFEDLAYELGIKYNLTYKIYKQKQNKTTPVIINCYKQ